MIMRRMFALVLLCLLAACREPTPLVLASTTSTEDSGLFDVLLPAFMRSHPGIAVRVVAVGTGQALELGRRNDADVLLVHAPAAESAFVAAGYGIRRCVVMHNDFVIVGPVSDPASVRGARDAPSAFRAIADTAAATFVSRGDDSGTHRRELELWRAARAQVAAPWYLEAGQGMGEVLTIASEKGAYTLTDRATYLAMRDRLALVVLLEGDPLLFNQYGVIPVARARNRGGAEAFAAWITSPEGQQVIRTYGVGQFGAPLFTPDATAGCGTS